MRQRDRKIPRSAITVSPRTVTSVTTHSYKCHHAQLQVSPRTVSPRTANKTNSQNPSGPILLHPAIHLHPPSSPSDTQSTGTRKELGDRLVKHRDWKRTKTCRSVITNGENPPGPISHHPVIHLYPLHLHQTHSLPEQERNSVRNSVTGS